MPPAPTLLSTASIVNNSTNADASKSLDSISFLKLHPEILILVATFVGLFGLAMLSLAFSLNGKQLCSSSHCRCCKRGGENGADEEEDAPPQDGDQDVPTPSYSTVNEFVFATDSDRATGMVDNVPTTMEQLFPDLLSSNGVDGNQTPRQSRRKNGGGSDEGESSSANAQLREPLL
ncbi:MAG: hypothetical protein SGILL_000487 [Bacillariaceae sp.]